MIRKVPTPPAVFLRAFCTIAMLTMPASATAQRGCTYAACPREEVLTDAESARIEAAVRAAAGEVSAVMGADGLEMTFAAKGWVPNARAYLRDGAPEIGYNPLWVRSILDQTVNSARWSLRAVLAHEVAHHVLSHPRATTGAHRRELEADALAGHAMHGMGATVEETAALWRTLPIHASPTHPSRRQRLRIVEAGWRLAEAGHPPEAAVSMVATAAGDGPG